MQHPDPTSVSTADLEHQLLSLPATHLNKVDFYGFESGLAATIGTNMRRRRQSLGLSTGQCATLMEVSPSQYQRYETGTHLPRLYNAVLLSLNTGIPISALFHSTRLQTDLEPTLEPSWQPVVSFISLAKADALHCLATVIKALTEARCPRLDPVNLSSQKLMPDSLTYHRKIGQNLRLIRESLSLSQAEAAEYFGVSEGTYRRSECPEKTASLSLAMVMRLYLVTGLDPLIFSISKPLFNYRLRQRHALEELTPSIHSLTPDQATKVQEAAKYFLSVFMLI